MAAQRRGRRRGQHCANCHGIEGQGGLGPAFTGGRMVWVHPDIDDQIDVIREGRGEMPPFDRVLSDEELRAVAEHERSL
jgi:mono/diheme cytochrome c family protein